MESYNDILEKVDISSQEIEKIIKQEVIHMTLYKAIVSIKNIVQNILIMDKFIKKEVQYFLNR